MSGPSFTPPAEVAEINRIHYELEYTEGISQRMRIPETLKVALESGSGPTLLQPPLPVHTTLMQVPERIVVAAGDDGESRFVQPRDLDLIQSVPSVDLLNMKAPPRVLTLTEQPLDSLETDQAANSQSNPSHTASYNTRSRRERSASENIPGRHGSHCSRGDVSLPVLPIFCSPEDANINLFTAAGFLSYVQSTTRRAYQQVLELLDDSHRRVLRNFNQRCVNFHRTHLDLALDMNPDESGLVDASSLRRQIVKLNRRLQLLEEENKERSKREVVLYSATVAFWLINTWIWLRR
uniref:Mitochondrial fission factor n=1 Tax=Poecilia formosa TaxID=48698 RepID=A0A096LWA8_POEFO